MQTFYSHAQRLAGEAARAAVQGQDGGTCVACIRLMNTILGWDFRWKLRWLQQPKECRKLLVCVPLGWGLEVHMGCTAQMSCVGPQCWPGGVLLSLGHLHLMRWPAYIS